MMRFMLPLVVFLVLAGFLYVGLGLESARSAVAADRQTGTGIHPAAIARPGQDILVAGHEGQGLAAQRLGILVRFVQGRASGADVAVAARISFPSMAWITRTRTRMEKRGCATAAIPTP